MIALLIVPYATLIICYQENLDITIGLCVYGTLLFFNINRHQIYKILVLTEHEHMGPNWTHAEGFILGVGAKMFTIAGPVIVYGLSASVVYGLIYWITTLF